MSRQDADKKYTGVMVEAPEPRERVVYMSAHYYQQCPALRGTGPCDCAQQAATDLYDSRFPEF